MKNYVLDTFYTRTLYGIYYIVLTYLFICGFLSFKDITTFIWEFGDIYERRNKSREVLGKLDEQAMSRV